jgi:hypothetical protein
MRFNDIYGFLGSKFLNDMNYNEYNNFDARYDYNFRQGDTKTMVVVPNSEITLTDYTTIEISMYSNNSSVLEWSGSTVSFTGDTSGEIYLNGSTLTINLTKEKSNILAAGVLYIAVRVIGSSTTEYQVYLGEVYKGFTS